MDNILYIIGQGLGIVAMIIGFLSYQMKTAKKLLFLQLLVGLMFSIHYYLIGAGMTGVALNLLSVIECVFFYLRDKKGSNTLTMPAIFSVLMIVVSIFTWDSWYSVFAMLGLIANTIALSFKDTQKTRYCMFIKSPLCLTYNAIVLSVAGIIYEVVVLTSSVIGVIINRKERDI